MVDVILFQDPIARARAYLSQWVPPEAGPFIDVPAGWKWRDLLVTITDTGGAGERDVVWDDTRLTVDVYHPDSVRASEVARKLHALIRQWPFQEKGIRFLRTLSRPTYRPDSATRTPGFFLTVELSFKASSESIETL